MPMQFYAPAIQLGQTYYSANLSIQHKNKLDLLLK
jgi:hypothetical protein